MKLLSLFILCFALNFTVGATEEFSFEASSSVEYTQSFDKRKRKQKRTNKKRKKKCSQFGKKIYAG